MGWIRRQLSYEGKSCELSDFKRLGIRKIYLENLMKRIVKNATSVNFILICNFSIKIYGTGSDGVKRVEEA